MTSAILGNQLIYAGFVIAAVAFLIVSYLHIRLRHYVAKEKVHAIEDVSQLWRGGIPATVALSDKGLVLRRVSYLAFAVSLVSIFFVALIGPSPRPSLVLIPIVGGCWLVAVFCESRLIRYLSEERIVAVGNVSRLWPFMSRPPKVVLNEKGLRLYRYMRVSATVFFIGIGIVFIGVFVFGIPDNDML